MMSLFSSFDAVFYPGGVIIFLILAYLMYSAEMKTASFSKLLSMVLLTFSKFLNSVVAGGAHKGGYLILLGTFSMVSSMNLFSVFPYNFPWTSQVSWVMSLALYFWGGLLIFQLCHNLKASLSHMVPQGAPMILMPFLVLIELTSNIIRPLTLTVRLVANITAGHLLLIMLSNLAAIYPGAISAYLILNVVEFMVSVIQAYIFMTMMTLYYQEAF